MTATNRTGLPLRMSLSGRARSLLEHLVAARLVPDTAGVPVRVDNEDPRKGETFEQGLARARRHVSMAFPRLPNFLFLDLEDPQIAKTGLQLDIDVQRFVDRIAGLPFDTAVCSNAFWMLWNPYRAPVLSGPGHDPLGWGAAFRGDGHECLVSRRWIEHGPWKLWRGPNDTSFVQFHALDADDATALEQAREGHRRIGAGTDDCGVIPPRMVYTCELRGLYEAATKTMRVVIHGREITNRELLEWAAARKDKHDERYPFETVAFVFMTEREARKNLPRLWRYEHQCWAIIDGAEVRLDLDYTPPDETPAWAREPAVKFSDVTLGEMIRTGTGDAVFRGTLAGQPVLVTRTNGHAALDAKAYKLPLPGIAPLAFIGATPGDRYEDALVERVPDGTIALAVAPIALDRLHQLALALAKVVAAAAANQIILDGVQPELVYVDANARFLALAPRGPGFVGSARRFASGLRSYPIAYIGHECAVLGRPSTAATDVFALCATVYALGTGRHPFGPLDEPFAVVQNIAMDKRDPWPEGGPLGELIARGLAADPAKRPTAAELVRELERS